MIVYSPPCHEKLDILYQDDFLLILNKPSGLLSVPGRGEDKQDCLISRVNIDFPSALIVHRLDMSTSGIIITVLDKIMVRFLNQMFIAHKIHKTYVAIVDGEVKDLSGEINQPLICDWPNRPKQKIDDHLGKASQTFFSVLEYCPKSLSTRVKLIPKTGRTHQLRVHMLSIGHPIIGDDLYAPSNVMLKSTRLLLHASSIEFIHPITKNLIAVHSDVPF